MTSSGDRTAAAVPATLDRELAIVRGAIDLVAGGGAPRVVLAGLRLVESILAAAEPKASRAGVRLVPIWTASEDLADLAVERVEA